MSPRRASQHLELVLVGFTDAATASDQLQRLWDAGLEDVLDPADLGQAADPDRALAALVDIAESNPGVREILADPVHSTRLLCVLGLSESLGAFLVRYPELISAVKADDASGARDRILAAVHGPQPMLDIRVAYRRELVGVAARDLAGEAALETTMAEIDRLG